MASCVVWSIIYYKTTDPPTHPLWTFQLSSYHNLGVSCCQKSLSPHFSKHSSAFRHFAQSLHVVSIRPFAAWFWFWMKCDLKAKMRTKRFSFPRIFIWTKTQKRDLKLDWQPLKYTKHILTFHGNMWDYSMALKCVIFYLFQPKQNTESICKQFHC